MTKSASVYVKEIATGNVVKTIDVTAYIGQTRMGQPAIDHIVTGLLRNMNHEAYFVDDSEAQLIELELAQEK